MWVVSDTHFGHKNLAEVFVVDGQPARVHPDTKQRMTVDECDELMVERWNAIVRPEDHVYHLGDVAMGRKSLEIVKRLSGHKRLLLGNHDNESLAAYREVGFQKIMASRMYRGALLTHIPVHPMNLGYGAKINIHGHIHTQVIPDQRYINVCVEQFHYSPILLDTLIDNRLATLGQNI